VATVVACYFNANFRIPPNLSSMLTHKALQILACRRKQFFNGIRQERSFADERRIADFDPLRKFSAEFSMTEVDSKRLHNPDNIPPLFKAIFGVPGNQAARGCAWIGRTLSFLRGE
jgi:hypothetical protein